MVLYNLSSGKDNVLSNDDSVKNKMLYLIFLIRYFEKKQLNNGFYFKKKKDAESFSEQYIEMMKLHPHLEREEGEKIGILEMRLIQKTKVES